jgi:F-box and WD-40 domain protein CDC4
MDGYHRPLSFSERRASVFGCDDLTVNTQNGKMTQQRPPRGPPTPSMSTPAADFDQQLTGSPPPPPTPAASPRPTHALPDWSQAADNEDFYLANLRQHFLKCNGPERTRLLADLLNLCTSQQLSFVHQFVSPLLKKDPFTTLPDELCLRVSREISPAALYRLLMSSHVRFSPSLMTLKFWLEPHRYPGDGEISSATT